MNKTKNRVFTISFLQVLFACLFFSSSIFAINIKCECNSVRQYYRFYCLDKSTVVDLDKIPYTEVEFGGQKERIYVKSIFAEAQYPVSSNALRLSEITPLNVDLTVAGKTWGHISRALPPIESLESFISCKVSTKTNSPITKIETSTKYPIFSKTDTRNQQNEKGNEYCKTLCEQSLVANEMRKNCEQKFVEKYLRIPSGSASTSPECPKISADKKSFVPVIYIKSGDNVIDAKCTSC